MKLHISILICLISITALYSCKKAEQDLENKNSPFNTMPMQVGIVVSDFDKSLDFYTNVLGMTELYRFNATPELATKVGLTDNKGFDAVVLKLNDEPGAAQYKLVKIHETKREPLPHSFVPGLRYITIHVKNMDQLVERIKKANVPMLTEEPIILPDGMRILNFLDPDGALVEIYGQ